MDQYIIRLDELLGSRTEIDYLGIISKLNTSYSAESDEAKILQGIKRMSTKKSADFKDKYAQLIKDYNKDRKIISPVCPAILYDTHVIKDEINAVSINDVSLAKIMKDINAKSNINIFPFLYLVATEFMQEKDDINKAINKIIFHNFACLN